MAAQRTPGRKREYENMVAYIHGIDPSGDVTHILVHQKGNRVRFSGKLGEHQVSPSNAGDLEKWILEAATVWGLEDAIGVLRGGNVAETLEKIETLNTKAAEKKENIEASSPQP
jgi:hypothetical protein